MDIVLISLSIVVLLIALFAGKGNKALEYTTATVIFISLLGLMIGVAAFYRAHYTADPFGNSAGFLLKFDSEEETQLQLMTLIIWGWFSLPLLGLGFGRGINRLAHRVLRIK